jgi:type IV secretion system protein VirB10
VEWRQARVSALREALVAPRTIRFDHHAGDSSQGDSVQRELARVAQQRAALGGASDPATAYQQAAAQAAQILGAQPSAAQGLTLSAGAMPLGPGAPNAGQPSSANARNDLRAFGKSGGADRWQLPSQVEDPASAYMLQAGSVIGAVLDSAVNSELPGPLLGHVSQPVYSSTGSHQLLIPQGTSLFGEYSADVVFGQNRLLVAWQRLRFPNGQTLDIGAMPGTDGVGRSGFEDQVDHHYLRLFGSALLLSFITTGVTLTQTPSTGSQDRVSAGSAMSQALGLQFGQVTAQLLQKNLNIAPTIEIRNGFRFNIVVTKDLTFRGPYTER